MHVIINKSQLNNEVNSRVNFPKMKFQLFTNPKLSILQKFHFLYIVFCPVADRLAW